MFVLFSTGVRDAVAAQPHRQLEGSAPLGILEDVSLDISVVLGTTWMPVHQVLRLGRGAIIELEATEEDEVKILANNMPIASGLVVVNGNRIAVEVKEMLPRSPDVRDF
jgi:flagellar motor switch protein FliN/FliY